jgi:hypothetical protein
MGGIEKGGAAEELKETALRVELPKNNLRWI